MGEFTYSSDILWLPIWNYNYLTKLHFIKNNGLLLIKYHTKAESSMLLHWSMHYMNFDKILKHPAFHYQNLTRRKSNFLYNHKGMRLEVNNYIEMASL